MTTDSPSRFTSGAFVPIAVADRNGLDESLHHGVGVVLDADGVVERSIGDPATVVYPRSALKPFQASAMVGAGLELPHRLLAVVAASHSGEQRHLDAVVEILERHDLTVDDLLNTAARPYGPDARDASIAGGVAESSLQQNCSGKHAGMLATCRINDWSIDSYLDVDHPLQVAITAETDRLAGRPSVVHVGIDGCGAPTHAMPLVDVATALRQMMVESSDVVEAMSAMPGLVGGTDRDVTLWMEAVPGLAAKEGADGVMVLALPDGRAAALKIADGSDRARQAVTIELLRMLDVDVDGALAAVRDRAAATVSGHGRPVGAVRPLTW